MHPLAPFAAAPTLALLCTACTAPSPGAAPIVAAPPPLALPPPAPVAMPSSAPTPQAFPAALAAKHSRNARPSRGPTLEEIAGHASGIYLARVERTPGVTRYIVTEIWRADLAALVAVGDVVQTHPEKPDRPLPPVGDQVIVYIFSPHLVRPDGTRISQGSTSIYDGYVPAYGMTVTEARSRLR